MKKNISMDLLRKTLLLTVVVVFASLAGAFVVLFLTKAFGGQEIPFMAAGKWIFLILESLLVIFQVMYRGPWLVTVHFRLAERWEKTTDEVSRLIYKKGPVLDKDMLSRTKKDIDFTAEYARLMAQRVYARHLQNQLGK